MIKFFRRIRQKLVVEGKLKNYLVYAIGEIALVVIGILIALQINNWNEDQKNNKLQKTYLAGIISDLEHDIKSYSRVITDIDEHRQSINAILTCYKEQTTLQDTLLIHHLTKLSFTIKFSHRSTVMDDMKSSGKLNLITSDSIRQSITEYYKLASGIVNNNEKNNDWILDHIIASDVIIDRFDFNSIVYHTDQVPDLMKSIEVNQFLGIPYLNDTNNPVRDHIINLLTAKNWLEGLNQLYSLNGKKKAIQLKEILEAYLNTIKN